jgi:hypothetical protein
MDFSRHTAFAEGLDRVEQVTRGPVGVGTRYRALERVPRTFVSQCEIPALDEPGLIAWKAWGDGVMRPEWEFRLSPSSGGTHLVQASHWQRARRPPAQVGQTARRGVGRWCPRMRT